MTTKAKQADEWIVYDPTEGEVLWFDVESDAIDAAIEILNEYDDEELIIAKVTHRSKDLRK